MVITVMAFLLVIMSFGHLLHDGSGGGDNRPAPQREGFISWVIRIAGEALIHRTFNEPAPETEYPEVQHANLYLKLPPVPPSEFLSAPGGECQHTEDW